MADSSSSPAPQRFCAYDKFTPACYAKSGLVRTEFLVLFLSRLFFRPPGCCGNRSTIYYVNTPWFILLDPEGQCVVDQLTVRVACIFDLPVARLVRLAGVPTQIEDIACALDATLPGLWTTVWAPRQRPSNLISLSSPRLCLHDRARIQVHGITDIGLLTYGAAGPLCVCACGTFAQIQSPPRI
jgi:hypothetical protein